MSVQRTTPEAIGVKTVIYQDLSRGRPVSVEIWYPAKGEGLSEASSPDELWVHPKEIRDAPFATEGERLPLILMSHGYGGDRRDRSWLAESLVKANCIVASVEHHGNSRTTFDPVVTLQFWERPRDISFALDQLLEDPAFNTQFNPDQIGFVGYSLGGMTGLALAGGVPDRIEEAIESNRSLMQDIPQTALDKVDFSKARQSYRDPRIRAALLLAPANFIYTPKALREIRIPVAMVSSIHDETLPHQEHAYPIIQNVVPRKLKVYRDKVSHSAFLNRMSEKGKKLIKTRASNADRLVVHEGVKKFAVEFFTETIHFPTTINP